jgi:hypothetical protein
MAINTVNHWEYAQWIKVIGRSLRMNPAVNPSAELTAAETFIDAMQLKRPWLNDAIENNSIAEQSATLLDNPQVIGKNVEIFGRNIMKIQIQDNAELAILDALIAATGNRQYGAKSGTIASDVDNS